MVTQDFTSEVYKQDTPEVFLQLLKIDHPDLDEPIRVVNNSEDIISDVEVTGVDQTFVAFPFTINLPTGKTGEISQTSLQIDNISRQISLAIRSISSAPTVTMWVVLGKSNLVGWWKLEDVRCLDYSGKGNNGIPVNLLESVNFTEAGEIHDTCLAISDRINLCVDGYSAWTDDNILSSATAPVNGTTVLDTSEKVFGTQSLKLTATAANAYQYFGTSNTDFNVTITANKKWVISGYIKSSISSKQAKIFIRASNLFFYEVIDIIDSSDSWQRIYGVIDLSSNPSTSCVIGVINDGGSGNIMWFDGLMLEEQIDGATTPSDYMLPGQTHVNIPDGMIDTTKNFTVSQWIYIDSNSNTSTYPRTFTLYDSTYPVDIAISGLSSNPYLVCRINNIALQISSSLFTFSLGTFYHIAVTVDNDQNVRMYINGSIYTTTVGGGGPSNTSGIGRGNSSDTQDFYGKIDDTRLYDRELSATEILALYNKEYVPPGTSHYSIEAGPYNFSFTNITYTAFKVQGSLSYEDILNQPYPKQSFTPNKFPAAF